MGSIQVYSLDLLDLQNFANDCKEVTLHMLESEGLLKGNASDLSITYTIILHRKGVLGKALDSFSGKEKDDSFSMLTMKLVKQQGGKDD